MSFVKERMQYSYPSSMDTNEIFHYGEPARLHQGMLGKPGAVLPGWRRVRERIGQIGAQQEKQMKVLAVSALPMGRCYPCAGGLPLSTAMRALGRHAPRPISVSQYVHFYSTMNPNRNVANSLKTKDRRMFYSTISRGVSAPPVHQSLLTNHHSLRGFHA